MVNPPKFWGVNPGGEHRMMFAFRERRDCRGVILLEVELIIGLCGYSGSGKDEVAKRLVEKHGYTRIAFADKVRELALALDPVVGTVPLAEVVKSLGWDKAKQRPEVRGYLQFLGTTCREILGKDVWLDAALEGVNGVVFDVVFTDVRFINEIRYIRNMGGVFLEVQRRGVGPVNGHISEREWENAHAEELIPNHGTIRELYQLVDRAVKKNNW